MNALATLLLLFSLASPSLGLEVRLAGEAARGRWVEVTPVAPGIPGAVFEAQDGAGSVALPGVRTGPVMLCAGGEERATVCERVFLEDGYPVTLAGPVPGVRVTGRLRIGKAPATGARVGFLPDPLPLRRAFGMPLFRKHGRLVKRLTVDADGRYSVLLAPGRYRLDITTEGGRTEQSEAFLVPDPRFLVPPGKSSQGPPVYDRGDLVLEDGLRVEVRVTDSAGSPLKEAAVGAFQAAEEGRFIEFQALSDASGHAVLSRIDGSKPVSVVCQAPGRLRFERRFEDVPDSVQCSLARMPSLQGRVLDTDDRPVTDALVSLPQDSRSRTVDKDGTFLFEDLPPGEHTLTVAAPGFEPATREASLEPEELHKLPTVRLEPGEGLTGRVMDGVRDEPIAGASVTVVEPPGGGSTVTDEDGGFRLTTGRPVTLEVSAEQYPSVFTSVNSDSQDELAIKLFPGGRIQVTAWDEEAGSPCAGCPVNIILPGGRSWGLQTGGAGEATSTLLAPGQYQVGLERVRSLGSAVQVQGGDDIRWATVEPGRTTRVELGEKASPLEVLFWPPVPEGWSLRADSSSGSRLLQPGTDGAFQIRRRRNEELTLTLQSLSGTQVRQAVVPGDQQDAILRLPLTDTEVAGTAFKDAQPVPGLSILLVGADGSIVAQTRTGSEGTFSVPYLAPGRYQLVVGGNVLRSFGVDRQSPVELGDVEIQ